MARAKPRFHAILLAGGSGTRFWPLSRGKRPKQLLALTGSRPLIEMTWKRIRRLAPADRVWVVAPNRLAAEVRRALPELDRSRLVLEPSARDTGPAVALACAAVRRVDPEAVVGIFPTDHVIRDRKALAASVRTAVRAAADGSLVCLGIRPDRPATGFGYLRCRSAPAAGEVSAVSQFVEKPDLTRARRYVRSGKYLWNAGMFVWRVDRFLEEVDRVAPRILRAVERHLSGHRTAWTRAPRLSVDYAVMEHARGVAVAALDAGWDDVGSWDAACRLRLEHARKSAPEHLLVDSPGTVVFGGGRTVAVVGLPDVAVVDTEDALLVVARDRSEGVKQVVEALTRRRRRDLL